MDESQRRTKWRTGDLLYEKLIGTGQFWILSSIGTKPERFRDPVRQVLNRCTYWFEPQQSKFCDGNAAYDSGQHFFECTPVSNPMLHRVRVHCVPDRYAEGLEARLEAYDIPTNKLIGRQTYDDWYLFDGFWFPRKVTLEAWLKPFDPTLRRNPPSDVQTQKIICQIFEVTVNRQINPEELEPKMHPKARITDTRFDPAIHYNYWDNLSETDLFEMAREAKIRKEAREEAEKKP